MSDRESLMADAYYDLSHEEDDDVETEDQFKFEVIADNSGKWAGNQIHYSSFDDASMAAKGLAFRWTAVRKARVVQFNGSRIINTTEVF